MVNGGTAHRKMEVKRALFVNGGYLLLVIYVSLVIKARSPSVRYYDRAPYYAQRMGPQFGTGGIPAIFYAMVNSSQYVLCELRLVMGCFSLGRSYACKPKTDSSILVP